jgi:hypothetical protein
MAHDHSHHHHDEKTYFTEQLFTIGVCGAIGGVMTMLYFTNRVVFLFGKTNIDQHNRVLVGGLGLLAIVLVRAVYVWLAAGKKAGADHHHHHRDHDHADCGHNHGDCGHDHHHHHEHQEGIKAAAPVGLTNLPLAPTVPHTHDHDHNHDHNHNRDHGHSHAHGHDHDHDHDHGWAPWRFVLLLLPVILFLPPFNIPSQSITREYNVDLSDAQKRDLEKGIDKKKGGEVTNLSFLQLERAAMNAGSREGLEGGLVNLWGRYNGDDPYRFTLVRYKLNCCAADALPLKAIIMIRPELQKKNYKLDPSQYREEKDKWVSVTGRLYFFADKKEYIPVIILEPDEQHPLSDLIKKTDPDPNPYAY